MNRPENIKSRFEMKFNIEYRDVGMKLMGLLSVFEPQTLHSEFIFNKTDS